jgi:hypothetical protein
VALSVPEVVKKAPEPMTVLSVPLPIPGVPPGKFVRPAPEPTNAEAVTVPIAETAPVNVALPAFERVKTSVAPEMNLVRCGCSYCQIPIGASKITRTGKIDTTRANIG